MQLYKFIKNFLTKNLVSLIKFCTFVTMKKFNLI